MATPAWKAAAEVADGYLLLNPVTLKRLLPAELASLQQELEKVVRDTRSAAVPADDPDASQKKSRKLLRLQQAMVILQSHRSRQGRV